MLGFNYGKIPAVVNFTIQVVELGPEQSGGTNKFGELVRLKLQREATPLHLCQHVTNVSEEEPVQGTGKILKVY